MKCFFKIHFINFFAMDYKNSGDNFCSPLLFFYKYFSRYNIIYHSIQMINYYEISKNDLVIIGGGGLLFDCDSWNTAINHVLEICENVVLWGAGSNSSNPKAYIEFKELIHFDQFRIAGVRDYKNSIGLEYVPCVSCFLPQIDEVKTITPSEKIGSMLSFGNPVSADIDNLDHFRNINEIFDFISTYEIIVTSSYHCAYWATLCNKKVIATPSSPPLPKIFSQKYRPTFISNINNKSELRDAISSSQSYPNSLDDCRTRSNEFFCKVQNIINEISPPESDINYTDFYLKKRFATFDFKVYQIRGRFEKIENKVFK